MDTVAKRLLIPSKSLILSDEDASDFMNHFPKVIHDMIKFDAISRTPLVKNRLEEIVYYNTADTYFVSSHLLIYCSKCIQEIHGTSNPAKIDLVYKMAWCLEIFIVSSLMMDDIIDGAEYRRNRKTWHTLKGPQSICDIYLLQSCTFKLLIKYFSHHKYYNRIIDLFIGSGLKAAAGETFQHELNGLESFTMENFRTIATFKTAIPGFVVPFQLACILLHREDCLEDQFCITLMKELGILFQIQNDYWDCYGESELGKTGNDIQENVCSVLIAGALQKANAEQKKILSESYGHYDPDKVEKVKKIYGDLKLENLFDELSERSEKSIHSELKRMKNDMKQSLMNNIVKNIYSNVMKKSVKK